LEFKSSRRANCWFVWQGRFENAGVSARSKAAFRIPQGQRVAPARRKMLGDDGNLMPADGNSFPVFILGWTIGAIGVECDGMTSLSLDATCRVEPKRGRVRALQSRMPQGQWGAGLAL
jgi:hypothetical protein